MVLTDKLANETATGADVADYLDAAGKTKLAALVRAEYADAQLTRVDRDWAISLSSGDGINVQLTVSLY